MKNMYHIFTAATIAAVLFSCGGNTTVTDNVDSAKNHTESQDHPAMAMDTAIITEGQSVLFESGLKDGETVKSALVVHFGVKGMKVMPLDSGVKANAGHFHLIIDTLGFIPAGTMVPMGSPKVTHYGKGQTESKPLDLKPGKHTLTLQFADGMHTSYGVRMSKTIEVVVK